VSSTGVMRIGEVHAQLRKLFPDIELSKIRYYEDKGLVQPSRSRKGYRLYSERDVACLKEAIRLAQEEFVPLRVVRLRLLEQGLLQDGPVAQPRQAAREATANVVSAPAPTPIRPVPVTADTEGSPQSDIAPIKKHFSINELMMTTGLTPTEFNQLVAMGMVTPTFLDGETLYSAREVRVAALSRALLSRGIDSRMLGSIRRIAEREVGVVDELTMPLRQSGSDVSPEHIVTITSEVAKEVAALRAVLVERETEAYLRA
jgi:DNA-binding transcriptional MerR regulator